MKINKLKSIGVKFAFALIISIASQVKQVNAQLTGFHAVYFQDQYLSNPAMAGITRGLNVELGYQQ